MILNAGSINVLRFISQTRFELIDKEQFSGAPRSISREFGVDLPYQLREDDEITYTAKEKAALKDCKAGNKDFEILQTSAPHIVVKMLFLDDIYRPSQFTWAYELLTRFFCASYHCYPEYRGQLGTWITAMAGMVCREFVGICCWTVSPGLWPEPP